MSITSMTSTRAGDFSTVTAVSDLASPVYFHWYTENLYAGATMTGQKTFLTASDEQSRVDVVDTNDRDFDPVAGAPDTYPSKRRMIWVRSIASDVSRYRVEMEHYAEACPTSYEQFPLSPTEISAVFYFPGMTSATTVMNDVWIHTVGFWWECNDLIAFAGFNTCSGTFVKNATHPTVPDLTSSWFGGGGPVRAAGYSPCFSWYDVPERIP